MLTAHYSREFLKQKKKVEQYFDSLLVEMHAEHVQYVLVSLHVLIQAPATDVRRNFQWN